MACIVNVILIASLGLLTSPRQTVTPVDRVTELLDADRAFSADAAGRSVIDALPRMFAEDVIMPVPGNRFAEGRANAAEALRANADNLAGRVEWTPIRGGLSADGQHGFTFGYMTLRRPDGTTVPLKYLSSWIRGADGWRVAAYKRRPRAAGDVPLAPMAPSLPERIVPAIPQPPATLVTDLKEVENTFSATAQRIGIGPAFAQFGSADAVNMGGRDDASFVVGAEAIGRSVGAGGPAGRSPVSWGADRAIVASSGDLGVTFGMIRSNDPAATGSAIPFFTIWHRASPTAPWKYIAE